MARHNSQRKKNISSAEVGMVRKLQSNTYLRILQPGPVETRAWIGFALRCNMLMACDIAQGITQPDRFHQRG